MGVRTGMIRANIEAILIRAAVVQDACLEVVAAWWGDGRIGCIGGVWKGENEG